MVTPNNEASADCLVALPNVPLAEFKTKNMRYGNGKNEGREW